MSCADIERRVALYAGGDLDEASARDVDRHLATCESCRALLAVLRGQREAMGEWRAAAPSPADLDDVRTGVLAAIARGDARQSFLDRIRFAPFGAVAWGSAGLAAAAMLVFAVWATVSRTPEAQPAPRAAAQPARPDARAVAVPAPRAESQADAVSGTSTADAAPAPAEQRAEARGETPSSSLHAAATAEERPAMRPRPEAARMGTAGVSLASASRDVGGDVRSAVDTAHTPPGPVRRIELQTADPNIRIIWLVPETAPEPIRSGAAKR